MHQLLLFRQKRNSVLHTLFDKVKLISENHALRIQSSVLNEVIEDAVARNPAPTDKGRRLRIYYATQVAVKPPTFVVFVNDPEIMHFSYERFLQNRLRESFGFEGTPIRTYYTSKKLTGCYGRKDVCIKWKK